MCSDFGNYYPNYYILAMRVTDLIKRIGEYEQGKEEWT